MGPWEEGRQCVGACVAWCDLAHVYVCGMHACTCSIDMGIQMHTLSEVNSGPLFTFIPCKDFINIYSKVLFPAK